MEKVVKQGLEIYGWFDGNGRRRTNKRMKIPFFTKVNNELLIINLATVWANRILPHHLL